MPVKTDSEPSVTTKLGILPNTVMAPLKAPSDPPSRAPNGSTSSPGLVSGMCLRPATVAVATNNTVAPTDKSRLPMRITKLAPSEAINRVAASPVVAAKFRQLKNAGDVNEKMRTSVRKTATGSQVPRSVRLGGRPVKRDFFARATLGKLLMRTLAPLMRLTEACAGSGHAPPVSHPAERVAPQRCALAALSRSDSSFRSVRSIHR